MSLDIPPQEQNRKWFRSHLLSRELELQELYDLPQGELDLVMAEAAMASQPASLFSWWPPVAIRRQAELS